MFSLPFYCKYRAGVTEDGHLNGIELTYYADCGYTDVCFTADSTIGIADNVYCCANWTINAYAVRTNTPVNTFCRSTLDALANLVKLTKVLFP